MPRSIGLIAAVLLFGGAAWAAGANLWIDVPFVKQQKDGCGAAAVAMVMQYWQQQERAPASAASDPEQILRALYSRSAHGIYSTAMVRYFEQHGYRAFAFQGQWSDFERELAKGRPLIAGLKPGPGPELHYVVVAGLDEPMHMVLLNDPAQRKLLKEDQSAFEHDWKATGDWTLLAVPRGPSR
jgi:ABC-type bacteriocin/lantibiotic exporter with double-glycine peptidase domain